MGIATDVAKVFNFAAKAYTVFNIFGEGSCVGVDIYKGFNDESLTTAQKTMRIGADVLWVGAQIPRLAIQFRPSSSPGEKVLAVGVGEGADLLRTVSVLACQQRISKDQEMDAVAQVVVAIARAISSLCENFPSVAGSYTPYIQSAMNIIQFAGDSFRNRQALQKAGRNVWSMAVNVWSMAVNVLGSDEAPPSTVELRLSGVLALGNEFTAWELEVHSTNSIDGFQRIPRLFLNDEQLRQYCCPITLQPIRFSVKAIAQNGESIRYEQEAVVQLLQQQPPRVPPNWPENLPLIVASLSPDEEGQRIINARLGVLLANVRAEKIEPDQSMVDLARQLPIAEGQTDIDISDRIHSNRRLFDLVYAISVYTNFHVFAGALLPQKARTIEVITNWVWLPGKHSSDLKGAARAILGSADKADISALEIVVKNRHCFRICFSADLQFLDIEASKAI